MRDTEKEKESKRDIQGERIIEKRDRERARKSER
jgi:hypothetical protein